MDVGDLSAEDSDEEAVTGETEALVAPTKSTKAASGAELPFTFPCPSTHGEFVRLLTSSNIKEEDTPLVVKRIRTLYHPGLAVGNKEKLQVSFTTLAVVCLTVANYCQCLSPGLCERTSRSRYLPRRFLLAYRLQNDQLSPTSSPHLVSRLSSHLRSSLRFETPINAQELPTRIVERPSRPFSEDLARFR